MSRQPIQTGISFADAEVESYERREDKLHVRVRAWNAAQVDLVFVDIIGVRDFGVFDICDVCEFVGQTPLLDEALAYEYKEPPAQHPYKVFQFLDLDDKVALEVVCTDVQISRGPSPEERKGS
jgi:hypothetical protein